MEEDALRDPLTTTEIRSRRRRGEAERSERRWSGGAEISGRDKKGGLQESKESFKEEEKWLESQEGGSDGIFFTASSSVLCWEFAVPARILDICLTFPLTAPPPVYSQGEAVHASLMATEAVLPPNNAVQLIMVQFATCKPGAFLLHSLLKHGNVKEHDSARVRG